ncbi:uncharacterized protein LOC124131731 [Haliotis rufescens]|uniref:uncharacterized protein LOC124131731 n=1 Tax=Haliotis rufescens TaxID=6454 RepID=UPI00201F62A0|nr:uncharacterized protein LOC124131731 [Haliotis rufescens]
MHGMRCKPSFGRPRDIATIKDFDVTPAGITSSGIYVDVLYASNAGGAVASNIIYAINACTGDVIGGITITGATNGAWDDLAVQACPHPMSGTCIFVHDVITQTVYIVQEESNPASFISKPADKTIVYTYKAGDPGTTESRSIFVDCQCDIYFFSRNKLGNAVRLYRIVENDDGTYTAKPQLQLDIPTAGTGPKGASLSRDCCELLVKMEDKIYYYPWVNNELQKNHALLLPSITSPVSDSIAWALDGSGFYTALESAPSTLAFSPRNEHVPDSKFSLGKVIGGVAKAGFSEISGIAASRDNPGFLYIISDTSCTDILVVQKWQGQVVSTYDGSRRHVVNVDWEDVAVGPGVRMPGDKGMPGNAIFINDGGADNGGPANNIYVFPEVEHPFVNRTATSVKRLPYRYLGKKFVSHAVMVACDGTIYVFDYVQNFGDPVNVYRLISTGRYRYAAVVVATFPSPSLVAGPEAADISACCDEILVKFRDDVYLYTMKNNDVSAAFLNDPCPLPYIPEDDGASVAFTVDCKAYLTIEDQDSSPAPLKEYARLQCCRRREYYY